jgi:8-amino-7-oxononanoate synthase
VVTFSKAAGCAGGAVCAKENFCRAALNFGRAYVYSTSSPAAMAAGIEQAIGVMRDEPARQDRVRELARTFRAALRRKGRDVAEGDCPIVPIIVGSESAAMEMSQRLLGGQLLVGAVRPPTVPRGTSRLRATLSCEHTEEEIARLTEALTL